MGGRGSVLGTLLGALLVQTVTSGVTQLGWKSQLSDLFVGIFIIIAVGTDLLRERARRSAMTATAAPGRPGAQQPRAARADREHRARAILRALLTQRIVLLAVLIVVVVVWFFVLDAGGYLTAPYDFDYMSSSLINAVPLAMLGLAELLVILSGRGGIDLSVGAIVSLAGMVFGFAYGEWGWPLLAGDPADRGVRRAVRGAQRVPRRLHRLPGADRDAGDVLRASSRSPS